MSLLGKRLTINKTHLFDINRRVTAHATQISWMQAPHATYLYEPDITDFHDYYVKKRVQLGKGLHITFTAIIVKAIGEAIKNSPKLNSILDYNLKTKVGKRHQLKEISVALPWLLADARMITPVIHDVGNKSLYEIAQSIQDIRRRIENTDIEAMQYFVAKKELFHNLKRFKLGVIRQIFSSFVGKNRVKITKQQKKKYLNTNDENKINSRDILDASILVSNLGSVFQNQRGGVTLLDLISPQVFAVAINAIQERPTVYKTSKGNKKIGIRKILPLSLTIDHRALDGADFIPFQNRLDEIFANPKILDNW
jgi:pyruvate dehydrogenase E2 component (dihydrolipoamide acetyltransferase)